MLQIQTGGKLPTVEIDIQCAALNCHGKHALVGLVERLRVSQIETDGTQVVDVRQYIGLVPIQDILATGADAYLTTHTGNRCGQSNTLQVAGTGPAEPAPYHFTLTGFGEIGR